MILFNYADPCFHYTTNVAVYRMKLPRWSEPFAVGLADCLLDVPLDILGIKYLWWTWHDTDPNIFDRSFHVPITRYVCAIYLLCIVKDLFYRYVHMQGMLDTEVLDHHMHLKMRA